MYESFQIAGLRRSTNIRPLINWVGKTLLLAAIAPFGVLVLWCWVAAFAGQATSQNMQYLLATAAGASPAGDWQSIGATVNKTVWFVSA